MPIAPGPTQLAAHTHPRSGTPRRAPAPPNTTRKKPGGPRSIWAPRRVREVGAQFPDRSRTGLPVPSSEQAYVPAAFQREQSGVASVWAKNGLLRHFSAARLGRRHPPRDQTMTHRPFGNLRPGSHPSTTAPTGRKERPVVVPPRTRPSMPDRVRVGLYEIFRRLAGNGPLLRILAGAARRPDVAVGAVPRAVGADRSAGSPSARRTATRCSTQALARPMRLSKHLGR